MMMKFVILTTLYTAVNAQEEPLPIGAGVREPVPIDEGPNVANVFTTPRRLAWIGDVWLPPSGKIYSILEIQQTFEKRRVLVIGDSLSRRLTASLAQILNDKDGTDLLDSVMDNHEMLGRGGHRQYEWNVPSGRLHYQWAPHANDVASHVRQSDLSDYTDVVVAIGVHDAERPPTSIDSDVRRALDALNTLIRTNVIWRTAPRMDNPRDPKWTHDVNARLRRINSIVLNADAPHVRVIDVATILDLKSVGKERLKGDSNEHFGNIARMVEIQTITRALRARGRVGAE